MKNQQPHDDLTQDYTAPPSEEAFERLQALDQRVRSVMGNPKALLAESAPPPQYRDEVDDALSMHTTRSDYEYGVDVDDAPDLPSYSDSVVAVGASGGVMANSVRRPESRRRQHRESGLSAQRVGALSTASRHLRHSESAFPAHGPKRLDGPQRAGGWLSSSV